MPKYLYLESQREMEVAMELEDDLSFADLSKQISLLIMEEDEDPLACSPVASTKAFSGAIHPPPQSFFLHKQAFIRRESKGTGVFIPQSTQPRGKQRKARSSSYAKRQKQTEENTRIPSQARNSCSFKPGNVSG